MLAALGVPIERVRDFVTACHDEQRANQLQAWEPPIGPVAVMRETLAFLGLRWELRIKPPAALAPQWARFAEAFRRLREQPAARVRCKACGLEQARPSVQGYGITDAGGCASCGCTALLIVH